MAMTDAMLQEAIGWHVRQHDLDADGWDAFATWLEADPAHADAYDRIALGDAAAAPALPAPRPLPAANDDVPMRGRRRWAIWGGSLATAAAALLVLLPHAQPGTDGTAPMVAHTAPASTTLADGTRIDLSPAGHLELTRGGARSATLVAGTALFNVRHDPVHPFELHVGSHLIRDVGTVFEVSRHGQRIDISVAEGSVMVDPDDNAILLKPGRRLRIDTAQASATVGAVPIDQIGAWRSGQLNFANIAMDEAVTALEHATGADIGLAPALRGRRFTGMVRLSGNAARDIPRFAELTGTMATQHGEQWVISPDKAAP